MIDHHDLRPPRHIDIAGFMVILLCAAALAYAVTVLLSLK
jgi:hypothetical protein